MVYLSLVLLLPVGTPNSGTVLLGAKVDQTQPTSCYGYQVCVSMIKGGLYEIYYLIEFGGCKNVGSAVVLSQSPGTP